MAYFDNPENAAKWEKELSSLRAERSRRQSRPGQRGLVEDDGLVSGEREYTREAESFAPGRESAPPMREPITFAQLEIEAGIRKAPSSTPAPEPERQLEMVK